MSQTANLFEVKSASLDVLALLIRTADTAALLAALDARFKKGSGSGEAFILDLEALPKPTDLDLATLLPQLSRRGFRVIGLRHPDPSMVDFAHRFGLSGHTGGSTPPRLPEEDRTVVETPAPAPTPTPAPVAPAAPAAPAPAAAMIIERPVRAGQQIYARGGDLIVLAMVSAGAELIADGNIHVYAPLRGRALAGARGNTAARIFTRSMEAELVSIAGVYRTLDHSLPDSLAGKSAQIYLENERLVMLPLGE